MSHVIIKLYQSIIDYGVMARHCEVAKKAFESELIDLESIMEKELDGLDEHSQDAYFSEVNDYWIETAETLPRLQWYAQFLTAYAYFEHSLNDVCDLIKNEHSYSLSLKDLYGQGISRVRNYLVKVAGISKPFSCKEWQKVKLLAEIRNAITHRNGFVDHQPNNPQSVYSRISSLENVVLKQELMNQTDAQIIFDQEFVLDSIKIFKSITSSIANELR